jgi:hypothetical protein
MKKLQIQSAASFKLNEARVFGAIHAGRFASAQVGAFQQNPNKLRPIWGLGTGDLAFFYVSFVELGKQFNQIFLLAVTWVRPLKGIVGLWSRFFIDFKGLNLTSYFKPSKS